MGDLARGHGTGNVPTNVTDMILLRERPDDSAGQIVHGWAGKWPPPPELIRIRRATPLPRMFGGDADDVRLVDPREQDAGVLDEFRGHPSFIVDVYTRHRASELDEPAPPDAHWFRGAEYIRQP